MDIEEAITEVPLLRTNNVVNSRFRKKNTAILQVPLGDNIPATQKIFVQVWGCSHNTSDAEYMAGLLSNYGYRVKLGGAEDDTFEQQVRGDSCAPDDSSNIQDSDQCGDGGCSECSCESGEKTKQQNKKKGQKSTKQMAAKEEADLWLLNSCTVKGPAEDHFRNAVQEGQRKGKKIVVAGCVPQGSPNVGYLKDVSVVGVQQIDRVVEVVEQTLLGNVVRFMEKKMEASKRLGGAPLSLPKIRRNPLIEILAISTGCLNACTYCKTKHARGVLASYPIEELVQRAIEAFNEGVKEVWLTSEDLGAYGRDLPRIPISSISPVPAFVAKRWPKHLTLADLLFQLTPVIPPGCMMRLGMTNPPYILDQLEEVAVCLQHPRVYAFLHVPVQSGSNNVLESMKREYTVDEFNQVVDFLTEHVQPISEPGHEDEKLTIATDIICGFPTETEADFQETVTLVQRHHFPVLYVNQFFARPGTPAASMKREATTAEVKQRTKLLHDIFRTYWPYAGREGRRYRVLITEASTDDKHWVGHTKAYEQILIGEKDARPDLKGKIVLVEVKYCDKFYMRGCILDEGPFDSLVNVESAPSEMNRKPLPSIRPRSMKTVTFTDTQSTRTNLIKTLILPSLVVLLLSVWIAINCL